MFGSPAQRTGVTSALLGSAAGTTTATTVRVVLPGGLLHGAKALAALAAATVGALLVPGVGLGETEDAAEVALALEAAERCFERLVGANGDLDQGIWAAMRRRGAKGC